MFELMGPTWQKVLWGDKLLAQLGFAEVTASELPTQFASDNFHFIYINKSCVIIQVIVAIPPQKKHKKLVPYEPQ